MVQTTLNLLPYLGIAVGVNILLGLFYNVRALHQGFSDEKLLTGISKAIIVGVSFISLAFVFDKMDISVELGDYLIKPDLLLYSAIIVYLSKDLVNLKNVLKVGTLSEGTNKILNNSKPHTEKEREEI